MKNIAVTTIAVALLLFFFAVSFQLGRSAGFETGSEWALMQADIVAREAGMSMPVYLDDGAFRVVIKQPPGLYKRAWRLSEKYEVTGNTQVVRLQSIDGRKEKNRSAKEF